MASNLRDMLSVGDPAFRSADFINNDQFRIPPQEMKPWRNIQLTVCSFLQQGTERKTHLWKSASRTKIFMSSTLTRRSARLQYIALKRFDIKVGYQISCD